MKEGSIRRVRTWLYMDNDRIAIPSKRQQCLQLRPQGVLPGSLIGKDAVYRSVLQPALWVLVKAADAHITDPGSAQRVSLGRECRIRVVDPLQSVLENAKLERIPTPLGPLSDGGTEYTSTCTSSQERIGAEICSANSRCRYAIQLAPAMLNSYKSVVFNV